MCYETFCGIQELVEDAEGPGYGATVFIHHSDCEGVWSADDAESMLHSLERLTPFLKKKKERIFCFSKKSRIVVIFFFHFEKLFQNASKIFF